MVITILFIQPISSTFIKKDEEFLRQNHRVISFFYKYGNGWRCLYSQFGMAVWLLKNIWKADVLYVWFSDYHSWLPVFLSRIYGKRSMIAVAGYDVAYLPEYNYGVFVRSFRGWCSRFTIRHADVVLPVARSLVSDITTNVGRVRGKIHVVPFGFNADRWLLSGKKRKNRVLTVAGGEDLRRMKIKGLDLFAQVAQRMPDLDFIIVGLRGEARQWIENLGIQNLYLCDPMPPEKLLSHFQEAKIYAQLSVREGLPNAICEAMLCGCIPVGTAVGGIPEAIGDAGYIIYERTPSSVMGAIRLALKAHPSLRHKARKRVMTHFSELNRYQALREIIEESVNR